jgi:hypothetical protein
VSSLITCGRLAESYAVVLHLANTFYTSSENRTSLFIRLKDMLMKQSQLIGIPLTISALAQIVKVEAELGIPIPSREEQEENSRYKNMEATAELEARGENTMRTLYRSNLDQIMSTWNAHQVDFEWLEKRIIYGLFLSDHEILDPVETEILVLASIMCQGLESPTMWHIRGLRRLGISVEDTEKVCDIVKMGARFSGKETSGWLMAKDVDISG